MSLLQRLDRIERRCLQAAESGLYRRADKPPFDWTGFVAYCEEMAREDPARRVLRQQSAAEHGDDDDP